MTDDRDRAFAEWLRTGEIPEWRQDQINDQALTEAIKGLKATITEKLKELEIEVYPGGAPRRLLVTSLVPDDFFFLAPMPTDEDPLAEHTNERQFLCSPATWETFKANAVEIGLSESDLLGGLPVVIEGE